MNSPRLRQIAALLGGLFLGTVLSPAQAGFAPPVVGDVRFTAPAPAMAVAPMNIRLRYRNEIVRLRLATDERGWVTHVRLLQGQDPGLERHLLPVVA